MSTIELEQMGIIVKVPTEAISLEIRAKIFGDDGEIVTVAQDFSPSQLREAREQFNLNVVLGDDYDATFILTDKAKEMLDAEERYGQSV